MCNILLIYVFQNMIYIYIYILLFTLKMEMLYMQLNMSSHHLQSKIWRRKEQSRPIPSLYPHFPLYTTILIFQFKPIYIVSVLLKDYLLLLYIRYERLITPRKSLNKERKGKEKKGPGANHPESLQPVDELQRTQIK